jgi:D-alanyl-D-alanine carboxypeptidase (penicillin-binding protein 5/6)
VADVALTSWLDKTVPAYVPTVVRVEIFDLNGPITQEINIKDIAGEATQGKDCGEIIWSQDGEVLANSPVIVAETVYAPDFFEGVSIGWSRFWGGLFGNQPNQPTKILLKESLDIPPAPVSATAEAA